MQSHRQSLEGTRDRHGLTSSLGLWHTGAASTSTGLRAGRIQSPKQWTRGRKGAVHMLSIQTPVQTWSPSVCTGFRGSFYSPRGCQSGHRSQSSSLWMSCPQHWASHYFLLGHRKPRRGGAAQGSKVGIPEPPQPAKSPLSYQDNPTAPSSIILPQVMFPLPGPTQSTIQGAAALPTISPGSMPRL